jgi:hypothetical protein
LIELNFVILISASKEHPTDGCVQVEEFSTAGSVLLHCGLLDERSHTYIATVRHDPDAITVRTHDESRIPYWLVTHDVHLRVLARVQLVSGTDLRAAMQQLIAKHEVGGWTVENNGAYGFFFSNLGGERKEVRMQPTDPSEPASLNNTAPRPISLA